MCLGRPQDSRERWAPAGLYSASDRLFNAVLSARLFSTSDSFSTQGLRHRGESEGSASTDSGQKGYKLQSNQPSLTAVCNSLSPNCYG